LTYYASSRPKKLVKVGSYIQRKVAKDIYWKRQLDIIVSIEICTALIGRCHANLNLFAANVVAVLQMTADSKNLPQIEASETCVSVSIS
jgi:hypothetical protein